MHIHAGAGGDAHDHGVSRSPVTSVLKDLRPPEETPEFRQVSELLAWSCLDQPKKAISLSPLPPKTQTMTKPPRRGAAYE
jgi:hypothetical protein